MLTLSRPDLPGLILSCPSTDHRYNRCKPDHQETIVKGLGKKAREPQTTNFVGLTQSLSAVKYSSIKYIHHYHLMYV